jgi:hypothetical protein
VHADASPPPLAKQGDFELSGSEPCPPDFPSESPLLFFVVVVFENADIDVLRSTLLSLLTCCLSVCLYVCLSV